MAALISFPANPHKPPRPIFPLFVIFRKKCVSKADFCISLLDTGGDSCYNPAHIEITL